MAKTKIGRRAGDPWWEASRPIHEDADGQTVRRVYARRPKLEDDYEYAIVTTADDGTPISVHLLAGGRVHEVVN